MKKLPLTCEERLQDLQQEFDEFAYIVSHDLKAPLRAICNLSGWISEDLGENLDADVKHNIHLLQNRAERMEKMISALLVFSRVSRYDLEVKEVNTADMVQKTAAPLQETKPFTLHAGTLPTLTTYAKKLETVLSHLLQNAVKFNDRAQPEVWVEAQQQEDYVLFTIKDNGLGMTEEMQEKVFNIFYTAQAKDHQENLGMGLPLVRKIVRFVGGTIHLQSEKGTGTQVQFTWPLLNKEEV